MKKWLILHVYSIVLILLTACSNDATLITKQEKDVEQLIKYAKLLDVEEMESKDTKLTEKVKEEKQRTDKRTKKREIKNG